jgi:predicted dehydrogenase
MIRAALVGVSGYGRWHLLMLMEQALVGRIRLVGVTIINPEAEPTITARLRRQGIAVFGSAEEMLQALAGAVDLVLLPTAIQSHARLTMAALAAGAHVLVEKPAAATLQDLDRVIAARDASQRLVAIGFQDLYVPASQAIKRRLLAGEIGRLQRIVVRAQWPRPVAYYGRNTWAGRLKVDGGWVLDSPVTNAYAHFVLLALYWAGAEPEQAAEIASVEAELYRAHAIESFDTVSLRARTSDGIEILFYGTHAGDQNGAPEIVLTGDRGSIHWVYEREYVVRSRTETTRQPVPDQLETRLTVLEAVVARIRGEPAFVVGPDLARAHTLLVNALHEYFPVRSIADAHVRVSLDGGDAFRRITGIDEAIATASARAALFSELGLPWAHGVAPKSLANYRAFSGCWSAPSPA